MFNKHSIFFTLKVGFLLCIVILLITFSTLIKEENKKATLELKQRYFAIANVIGNEYQRYGLTQNLEDIIQEMNLKLIQGETQIDELFNEERLKFLFKKREDAYFMVAFKSDEHNYIHLQTAFDELLLVDTPLDTRSFNKFIFLMLVIILALGIVYFILQKRLKPLKELKEKIDQSSNEDEVSLITQEFKHKDKSLKKIKEARNVFIRNIMHELKTPITKGKFLVELPQTPENKESMKKVFYRLESLIGEFVSIEEIISKDEAILKKEYFFEDILDNAINLLMIDDSQNIKSDISNEPLLVNFKLFSIVVKNLIDNAFKYAKTPTVYIKQNDHAILFLNDGEPLKYELKDYMTPFNKSATTNSFGLGLYIIQNILTAHDFKFEYEYKEGKNCFKIVLEEPKP